MYLNYTTDDAYGDDAHLF